MIKFWEKFTLALCVVFAAIVAMFLWAVICDLATNSERYTRSVKKESMLIQNLGGIKIYDDGNGGAYAEDWRDDEWK